MNNNTKTFSDLIRLHLRRIGKEEEYIEAMIKNHWEEITNKAIAKNTRTIFLKKGTLYVEIESSILKNELNYLKDSYRNKINEFVKGEYVKILVFF